VSGWVLDRMPTHAASREYEQTAAVMKDRIALLPGLRSVYSTGSVSVPGISDLDLIAVVDGNGPFPSVWGVLSERERYVAMHTPFLVDVETFARHRWFAHIDPLVLVLGEGVEIEDPPHPEPLALLAGVEGLIAMRLKLEKQRRTARLKVRPTLCELNNLRHDLRLAGLPETAAPRAWAVVSEVTELRAVWWQLGATEQKVRSMSLAASAITALDDALEKCSSTELSHPDVGDLRLSRAWRNVTLVADSATRCGGLGKALPLTLSRRSHRLSEVRWRTLRCRLPMPTAVRALLHDAATGTSQCLDQRRRLLNRYLLFMADHGKGWSSIGLAQMLVE